MLRNLYRKMLRWVGDSKMGNRTALDQWQEYRAKFTIERLFPEYGLFKKAECPDLHGNGIGIEIVTAYSKAFNRAEHSYENYRIAQLDYEQARAVGDIVAMEKALCRMNRIYPHVFYTTQQSCRDDLCHESIKFINTEFGEVRTGSFCGDYFRSQLPLVQATVRFKCDKLNSKSAGYLNFERLGLFIESAMLVHDWYDISEVCRDVRDIIETYERRFDVVFFAYYRAPHYVICYDFRSGLATYKEFHESLYADDLDKLRTMSEMI